MSHLGSLFTNSTYIKENWALDGFESRMALDLRGVGSINHAHAHSRYNLGPIKNIIKKKNIKFRSYRHIVKRERGIHTFNEKKL